MRLLNAAPLLFFVASLVFFLTGNVAPGVAFLVLGAVLAGTNAQRTRD